MFVEHRVLVTRNSTVNALDFGSIAIVTQVFLDDLLQNAFLVVVIVYREIRIVPVATESLRHKIPIEAHLQEAQTNGMERSHPVKAQARIQEFLDTLVHLAGSLVRERHRKDPARLHFVKRHQMGNLVGNCPRLSRTGTSQNKHRAVNLLCGSRLLRIEFPIQHTRINHTCHQKLLIAQNSYQSIGGKYKTIPPKHRPAGTKKQCFSRTASSGASVPIWGVP